MPVESAADRAAFFNPDEFGEWVRYRFGIGPVTETVAVWVRPGDRTNFGGQVQLDVHRFIVDRGAIPTVVKEGIVTVVASGETFSVVRPVEASQDGALETILAVSI